MISHVRAERPVQSWWMVAGSPTRKTRLPPIAREYAISSFEGYRPESGWLMTP
jgi:hypothetical protein